MALFNYSMHRTSQSVCRLVFVRSLVKSPKVVLGIETSCDDTGAAVVNENGKILGEAVISQTDIHLKTGGIIPSVAQRLHNDNIDKVVKEAVLSSGISLCSLSAIATTVKPGLALSLGVGLMYSLNLVKQHKKPFIPIHHMEAHALTARLMHPVEFPYLVLLISGGHCILAVVNSVLEFLLLGQSLDEAPGESLDKGNPAQTKNSLRDYFQKDEPTTTSWVPLESLTWKLFATKESIEGLLPENYGHINKPGTPRKLEVARRLLLNMHPECFSMSGGQSIEHLSQFGDKTFCKFTLPMSQHRDCNFSFAGLRNHFNGIIQKLENVEGKPKGEILTCAPDVAASFQHAVAHHIVKRTQRAILYCRQENILPPNAPLVASGGVASNGYIRKVLQALTDSFGMPLVCPPPHLCTDNGVMIAWNGIERLHVGVGILNEPYDIRYEPRAPLGTDISEKVRRASIKLPPLKI